VFPAGRWSIVLDASDLGHRVVVRRIVGKRGDRPVFSDALGQLTDVSETHFTVRTADGPVRIPKEHVATAKRVPDQRARSATERLELVAAQGWPAPDTGRLGDWLLRAASGWTARGNSALAVGDPGRTVGEAVDAVVDWYTARDLRPAISVPRPLGGRIMPELDRRGWTSAPETLVQTAPLEPLARPDGAVRVDAGADETWLAHVGGRKGGLPAAARHILTAPPQVGFASGYTDRGVLAATGRGVVTGDWLGISVVGVTPEHRRQGWARRVTRALGAWALARGATRGYLQVEAHNEPALALYAGLGFTTAHGYVVRAAPPRHG
jgi:N-acetylglutamate synthase